MDRKYDRVLIAAVVLLVALGITLMVVGFGSAGWGVVQPTPTMGKLSDFLTRVP